MTTISHDIDPTDCGYLRLYFDLEVNVGIASVENGQRYQDIDVTGAVLTGVVLTDLPGLGNSEVQCVAKTCCDWLPLVHAYFDAHPLAWQEFVATACEQAERDAEGEREWAMDRESELRAERWLEARGLT